jgi:hypothetical protein
MELWRNQRQSRVAETSSKVPKKRQRSGLRLADVAPSEIRRIRLKKRLTYVRLPLKSWNIPQKITRFFSIRVTIFSAQRIWTLNVRQTLGASNETSVRVMWPTRKNWLFQGQAKRFRHWNPKIIPDSRNKRLKCLPARWSQRHPEAPAPQGQAATVRLFGTDCSDYDPSGQSKSPE